MVPEQEMILSSPGVHCYFPSLWFAMGSDPQMSQETSLLTNGLSLLVHFLPQTVKGQWLRGLRVGRALR